MALCRTSVVRTAPDPKSSKFALKDPASGRHRGSVFWSSDSAAWASLQAELPEFSELGAARQSGSETRTGFVSSSASLVVLHFDTQTWHFWWTGLHLVLDLTQFCVYIKPTQEGGVASERKLSAPRGFLLFFLLVNKRQIKIRSGD